MLFVLELVLGVGALAGGLGLLLAPAGHIFGFTTAMLAAARSMTS